MPRAKSSKHTIKPVDAQPDFIAQEKELLKSWYESGIVDRYLHKNDQAPQKFFFQDGPITANNPMGVHHAWGRTYKDLWQRFYNMRGFAQRFQNGFDCQGLWVEVEVEKELGFKTKKEIESYGIDKFVQQCKDRVLKYSGIQTDQSKRLGYFMDWDNSYFTMSDQNNYMIWHFLKVCHQNGWIYKGHDSVPWCPRCQTAISQHEMLTEDYKEVTHKAIYLELPLVDKPGEFLIIWTTTPWTIPANIAVTVDPKLDYVLVKGNDGNLFYIAKDALDRVFGQDHQGVVKTLKGKDLVGLKYLGPFDHLPAVKDISGHPLFHTVIATDEQILPITTTEGTGLVHTAVSAGSEDFKLGQKLGLPMIPVINDDASYLEGLGFLSGQNAKKHPELILDYLTSEDQKDGVDWVFKLENYTHRYPACWRCKTELVWKVTDEWYIAMDKGKPTLRERMKKVARQINWIPEFGLDRELDWLDNMHDWLISKKNRYWGLSLPIWECSECGHFQVIGSREELEQKAVSGWDQFAGKSPHKPQIDAVKIKCDQCGGVASRIEPVGNPWLDAGIVPFSTLIDPKTNKLSYTDDRRYFDKWFPADFITESFPGQFKNWFYSMIAMSTVLEDTTPFNNVLGFNTMLGEDGRAMHKSWGNSIEFNEAADKIGVDVMRWTFARHNPERNLLFGYNLTNDVKRRFHMILWNSYRFFVNYASMEGWTLDSNQSLTPTLLDDWILSRLTQTVNTVTSNLEKYNAFSATQAIEDFVQDLSTWYIRRSRDRIGPNTPDSDDKNTCYHTLYTCFETLSRLLMPFTPFLADQIYTNLTGEETVHLANWPQTESKVNQALLDQMKLVRQICELGHSQRKSANIPVRQPLSSLKVKAPTTNLDPALIEIIKSELNIKEIVLDKGEELKAELDLTLTPELQQEGEARKLIRDIQQARKEANCAFTDQVDVTLPDWPESQQDLIKSKALVRHLTKGPELTVTKV